MSATIHARLPARRGIAPRTWWAKAWHRAVEEAAYGEPDLKAARRLARTGQVGQITVEPGLAFAAVTVPSSRGDETHTPSVRMPQLTDEQQCALVEVVASAAGRIASLLARELPHQLVEDAEEAGAELLPYGGEWDSECACDAWIQPCPHALALLLQVGWLAEADPLVLFALRGLPREELLSRMPRVGDPQAVRRPGEGDGADGRADGEDLDVAVEAAALAAALLETHDGATGTE